MVAYLVSTALHLGVTGCPLQVAAQADAHSGVRLGALVGPFGGREAVVPRSSQGPGAGGRGRDGAEGREAERLPADPRPGGFKFVRQDELAQLGAPGVALGGDVHVGGVGPQEPGTLQAEGDALSAAVHLHDHTQREKRSKHTHTPEQQGAPLTAPGKRRAEQTSRVGAGETTPSRSVKLHPPHTA